MPTSIRTSRSRKNLVIRPMVIDDILLVVTLHRRLLPTMSTKIGGKYIDRLYEDILNFPKFNVALVALIENKIVGAITCSRDVSQTEAKLSTLFQFATLRLVLTSMLMGRISISDILQRLFHQLILRKIIGSNYPSILTIFVDSGVREKGVGKILIDESLQRLKLSSGAFLYVDTLSSNFGAKIFYSKIGFEPIFYNFGLVILKKQV